MPAYDKELEGNIMPPQRLRRVSKPLKRYQDVVMPAFDDPIRYEDEMDSPEKDNWKFAIKEERETIECNNT